MKFEFMCISQSLAISSEFQTTRPARRGQSAKTFYSHFTCLPPPFPPPSEFRWKVSSGKVRGNKVGTVEMRAVLWPTLRTAPEGKVYLDGRKEERSMGSRRTSAALVNASWLPWAPTFPHTPPHWVEGLQWAAQNRTESRLLTTVPQMLLRLGEKEKPDGKKASRAYDIQSRNGLSWAQMHSVLAREGRGFRSYCGEPHVVG